MSTQSGKQPNILRRKITALIAGASLALLATATGPLSAISVAEAAGNTIVFALESDFSLLDPHASRTWNTFNLIRHIFETFVEEDLTKGGSATPEIVPALAESWDVSPNGQSYTFHLRKNVKFHDGTPWNAEAAKFNMDRMTNTSFKYHQPLSPGLMGWMWQDLAGCSRRILGTSVK